MDRWEREQDRETQRKLREAREADAQLRRQARDHLVAGHGQEHERVSREHDDKLARGFQRDPEFERAIAELERTDSLNPQWRTRQGYYESRKAAADRVAKRKDNR